MEYKTIPGLQKPVSALFFGTAFPAMQAGGDAGEVLDAAVEAGVNAFDTAAGYGGSEQSLGRWLQTRRDRERLVILTKCCHPDLTTWQPRVRPEVMREELERSLERLHTDYVDILLLHRDDEALPVGPMVEGLHALVEAGRVRAVGGSNWTHTRIAAANDYARAHGLTPFSVSSPNFSLARQVCDPWGGGCVTISGPENRAARDWYAAHGVAVVAYSCLGRGLLSGKVCSGNLERLPELLDAPSRKGYVCEDNLERLRRCEALAARKGCAVSQIALAWLLGQRRRMNVFGVCGLSTAAHVRETLNGAFPQLTQAETAYLNLEGA